MDLRAHRPSEAYQELLLDMMSDWFQKQLPAEEAGRLSETFRETLYPTLLKLSAAETKVAVKDALFDQSEATRRKLGMPIGWKME